MLRLLLLLLLCALASSTEQASSLRSRSRTQNALPSISSWWHPSQKSKSKQGSTIASLLGIARGKGKASGEGQDGDKALSMTSVDAEDSPSGILERRLGEFADNDDYLGGFVGIHHSGNVHAGA
mmetsp:Transcript_44876/g.82507  ORF Transcript_44876/g.82507 Transcript_44876/m.82507 type:complete len:124 (+) Transcript_44876:91-462(+)